MDSLSIMRTSEPLKIRTIKNKLIGMAFGQKSVKKKKMLVVALLKCFIAESLGTKTPTQQTQHL